MSNGASLVQLKENRDLNRTKDLYLEHLLFQVTRRGVHPLALYPHL